MLIKKRPINQKIYLQNSKKPMWISLLSLRK